MESKKKILMNLCAGQQISTDIENRLMDRGAGEGRRGWDKWTESHGNIYLTICKTHSQWELVV